MTPLKSAFLRLAMVGLVAVGFAACEDEDITPALPTLSVNLVPDAQTLTVGETLTMVANTNGLGTGETATVTFTSSNQAVASVANGVVTARAPGVAVITATATTSQNRTATDASTITVVPIQQGQIDLQLQPTQANISVGGAPFQFIAVVTGTTNTAVTCQTSDATIATATANASGCLVTAVGPGTAVLTVRSAANNQVVRTATVTVGAQGTGLTVTPNQINNLGVGQVQTLVTTIQGTNNQAVTCTSSNTAVATVVAGANNVNCTVTGVAAGNAVVTVRSQANNNLVQTVPVTVVGASAAISTITTANASPLTAATGIVNTAVNVSVPAGTADSLVLRFRNTATGNVIQVTCQRFTSAGAATTVICPINPADIDPNTPGAQILPNATFEISAVLLRAGQVAAQATFASPITTANLNTVAGSITFDNSLVDNDNIADAPQDVDAAGNVWFGGSVTVNLTPSVFAGNTISTASVSLDVNCDGTADATRSVTFTGGTGSVTFSEANNTTATTPGVDNVENPMVCFIVSNARDAGGAGVDITGGGTGNVVTTPGAATTTTVGANQNQFRLDNVQPTVVGTPSVGAPFITGGFTFSGGATGTVSGLTAAEVTDGGVGRTTFTFFAPLTADVPAGATQTQLRALATTPITSGNQLQSSIENNRFTLLVRATDALGNATFTLGSAFGVDLTAPTIALANTSAPNNAINPAAELDVVVTDDFSGPQDVRARITGYSVLEVDSDAGTEVRCYTAGGGAIALPSSGVCPLTSQNVVLSGTSGLATVVIPADENFYVIELVSRDVAGNVSATTITRNALVDAEAPTATIASFTVSGTSASISGSIRDNIDIDAYDTRFEFAGLQGGGNADELPFTGMTDVDSFGLPLTGVASVTGQTGVRVDGVQQGVGGTVFLRSGFGFGVIDVAQNYGFGEIALAAAGTDFNGFVDLSNFTVTASPNPICRTGTASACPSPNATTRTSTNLNTVITTPAGSNNPIQTVYYYFQHPDGYWVLIGSVNASNATVLTGAVRTFSLSQAVAASAFPSTGTFTVAAVGVDADGDAIMVTNTVTVQ